MEKIKLATHDKREVTLYLWDKVEKPTLVVQLVHGMCEHSARYDDFAKFLNKNGIITAMNDQRGHGLSTMPENYGYDDGDMWENNIADQMRLSEYLRDKYNLPIVMFGHSYGSFLSQRLLEINPVPVAFVLSGSCYMNNILTKAGAIISALKAKKDPKGAGKVMADMSFKAYEKTYPGVNSWLNRDKAEVDKYNADPACGYIASNSFYASFMRGLKSIYKRDSIADMNINRPVYMFSGEGDPVGEYGKGVKKLYDFYKKVGVKDVTMKLYPEGRHEMLNEINKKEVYVDVVKFLDKFCQKG